MQAFHVACLSDLHLGHGRNDTAEMIAALDASILTSGLITRIKLLLLAGDVFDALLDLNHPNLSDIDHWINRLFKACVKHDVVLRVLEGTPSHDRHQSKRFDTIYHLTASQCDFKYVEKIEIERIEKLGIDVLYIPDEISPTTQDTQAFVSALLESRGVERVDITCMHGYFKYQLPYVTKETHYHDEEFFNSITKTWIFIGHVHTHTRRGKIIAQGSHDRLTHGQEEPKGFVEATIGRPKGDKAWFIENTRAHVYKTIAVYDTDVEVCFNVIEDALTGVGDFARVRIEAEPEHPIFEHMVELQKKYPSLNFTKHPKKPNEDDPLNEAAKEPEILKWHAIIIDATNIVELMNKRLSAKNIEPLLQERAMFHLSEAL